MTKKIIVGVLGAALVALLVVGAVNRTTAKIGNETAGEHSGGRWGQTQAYAGPESLLGDHEVALGNQQINGGQGRGQGQGNGGNGNAQSAGQPNPQAEVGQWLTVRGTIASITADELVVETAEGEIIIEGQPWRFAQAQGFTAEVGDEVELIGFDEDGKFVVGQIILTGSDQKLALRDETGRPGWAGQSRGNQGRGQGQENGSANQDSDGEPQADVTEWLTVNGTVVELTEDLMTVETDSGKAIVMEGRPWRFALEQGFTPTLGDEVTLVGFDEDGRFEVGEITDHTNGQSLRLRDENGRPGWSGRGRRA